MAVETESFAHDDHFRINRSLWRLCFDFSKGRFGLTTSSLKSDDCRNTCVKELSLEEMKKFGGMLNDSDDRDDSDRIMCANCGSWLSGLCFKHPLVFIKESTPTDPFYVATVTPPSFFYLDDSVIPNAGKGVFTSLPLPSGLAFGPYSGYTSSHKDAESSGYSWQIWETPGSESWVDAKSLLFSNWMRFVNCPRFQSEQNMVALLYGHKIYYCTYKPIEAHSELMVWYGGDYGAYLKIPHAKEHHGPFAPENFNLQGKLAERNGQRSEHLGEANIAKDKSPV